MYLGRIVEIGPTERVFAEPAHPYTAALLGSMPVPDPTKKTRAPLLQGDVPSPSERPTGCSFASRCPLAIDVCRNDPPLGSVRLGRSAACHRAEEVLGGLRESRSKEPQAALTTTSNAETTTTEED